MTEEKLARKLTRELYQIRLEMWQQGYPLFSRYVFPYFINQVWPRNEFCPPKPDYIRLAAEQRKIMHKFKDFGGKCWCGFEEENHMKIKNPALLAKY